MSALPPEINPTLQQASELLQPVRSTHPALVNVHQLIKDSGHRIGSSFQPKERDGRFTTRVQRKDEETR